MNSHRLRLAHACVLLCITSASYVSAVAQETHADLEVKSFMTQHCIRCHGEDTQKADRRLDNLPSVVGSVQALTQWQEVLDIINLGEMPPEDESQPSTERTRRFVAAVTDRIETARATLATDKKDHARRLNRYEYRNTIRDLLGVNTESFDPTTLFPADERLDGFENIGEQLVFSDFLMQRYLEAAAESVGKAFQTDSDGLSMDKVFSANDLCDRKWQFRPQIMFEVNADGNFVDVAHGDLKSDRVNSKSFRGVPADGFYTLRIKAEAINRKHPYNPKMLPIDPDEPLKMEVMVADPTKGGRLSGNPTDRRVALIPLLDHEPTEYEFRVWMDKGYVPLARYVNGPKPIKSVLSKIAAKYHADVLPSNWRSGTDSKPAERQERYLTDVYQGPRMRVYWMKLAGPEKVPAIESSRGILLGSDGDASDSIDAGDAIKRFLFRAFRRPPRPSEVDRYQQFMTSRLKLGESERVALRKTFTAVLCSPNFLYLQRPAADDATDNPSFQIASRLSYFLWSSMPDAKLFDAASRGELTDPVILTQHAKRMLKDTKAHAFTEHFTDSWLRLNELGSMPPDTVKFKLYYERLMEPMMKQETRLFFQDVLTNNLSIEQFIDSDFTYVNQYLAEHYSISDVVGDEFRKVSLPADSMRGGLLGQASILTATSNGVETSPVTRGIWVLENILGTPPAPPPPDVEPLEPDIRGATTIRQQLAKHRNVKTCAECHQKIDPIGFALESFNPIGVSRTSYGKGDDDKSSILLDTSGQLVSGEKFRDITELKRLLVQRKDQFANCLTRKMLTYALGREITIHDRPQVDLISKELASRGYGLRDLVELVVTNKVFQ